jgi:hypothetical protein
MPVTTIVAIKIKKKIIVFEPVQCFSMNVLKFDYASVLPGTTSQAAEKPLIPAQFRF